MKSRKKVSAVLLSLIMAFNICGVSGYADNGITVTLNESEIEFDVQPRLIDGRTMVPIRAIFEAMGADVAWNEETQTAICTKDKTTVKMTLKSTIEYINGVAYEMDAFPVIIDDRTLAPARYVAEAFGYNVDWNEAAQTVIISDNNLSDEVAVKFVEGYEAAEFSKYNSPASENGLAGNKIYLQAKLDSVDVIKTDAGTDIIYGFFTDNNDHRWYSTLNVTLFDDTSNYSNLIEKPLVVCGIYQGYSEKYKVPAFDMYKLMNLDTGDTKTGFAKINESLNIQSEKSNTDKTEDKVTNYDFTSTTGIESYLYENYKTLNTDVGKYTFSYGVTDYGYFSEDFCIDIEADGADLGLLIEYDTVVRGDYTDSEIENGKNQLKSFIKTIASDLIDRMPNKKLTGSYHDSHYRYPNLKMNLIIEDYYTWANYDRGGKNTSASTFRWLPNLDGRNEY